MAIVTTSVGIVLPVLSDWLMSDSVWFFEGVFPLTHRDKDKESVSLRCETQPAKQVKQAELRAWIARFQRQQDNKLAETDKTYATIATVMAKDKIFPQAPEFAIWRAHVAEALRKEMQFSALQAQQQSNTQDLIAANRELKLCQYKYDIYRDMGVHFKDPVALYRYVKSTEKEIKTKKEELQKKLEPLKQQVEELNKESQKILMNFGLGQGEKMKALNEKAQKILPEYHTLRLGIEACDIKQQALDEVQTLASKQIVGKTADVQHDKTIECRDLLGLNLQAATARKEKAVKAAETTFKQLEKIHVLVEKIYQGKPLTDDEVKLFTRLLEVARLEEHKYIKKYYPNILPPDIVDQVEKQGLDCLKLPMDKLKNQWPKNFTVSVATGQRELGWGDGYFENISLSLTFGGEKSLPEIIQKLEQSGGIHTTNKPVYGEEDKSTTAYQVPVSSTNIGNIKQWVKGDKTVKRQVLYIDGMVKNEDEADRNEKAYKKFELALKLAYGNDVVITRIKPKTEKEVAEAFDKLQASVDEKTEVLIVMNGHGSTSGLEEGVDPKDAYKEGAQVGVFWLDGSPVKKGKPIDPNKKDEYLSETFLKDQVKKLNKAKSGMIIINACHSGAWIAQGPPNPQRDPMG